MCVCVPVYMNKYRAISHLELTSIVMKYLLSISCILIVIWVLENKSKAKKKKQKNNPLTRRIIDKSHSFSINGGN